MAALRSRRLEALFGMSVPDVKAEQIRQLVVNAVTEEFDLDFKQSPYGNSDGDKRALRIDVAALANTAGGVIIIIGVEEDEQARATAAPGCLQCRSSTFSRSRTTGTPRAGSTSSPCRAAPTGRMQCWSITA